jgi:hypothetical protein
MVDGPPFSVILSVVAAPVADLEVVADRGSGELAERAVLLDVGRASVGATSSAGARA